MLYLRIEDRKIILADYSSPSAEQREEALRLGTILTDDPVLTLAEHPLNPELSFRQNLVEARQQHPLFAECEKLEVLVNGPMTICPIAEYEDEEEQVLFKSCFAAAKDYQVFSDVVPSLRLMLLFGVTVEAYEAVMAEFGDADIHFTSALTMMLRHFSVHFEESASHRLYINCRDHYIDVFAFKERRLLMFNTYEVNSVTDLSYYVLAMMQLEGIPTASTPIYLIGDKGMGTSAATSLKRFTTNVRLRPLFDEFGKKPIAQHSAVPYDLGLKILSL